MSDWEVYEEEYDAKFDLSLWRRILAHANPYRRPLVGLGISGAVLASVDVLLPLVTGWVIDDATSQGGAHLGRNVAIYAALVTVLAGLVWTFIVLAGRAVTGFAHDVRREAFHRLQELSFSFYDKQPVGWLMARLTSDAGKLANVIPWTLLDVVWGSVLLTGIAVMMLFLNWKLALLVMAIMPPLTIVSMIFQRKLLRSQRAVRKTNSRITSSFNEGIMGVRTTKSLVREGDNLGEFQEESTLMFHQSVRNALQGAVYMPIVLSFGAAGVGLALWQGGVQVGTETMTLGTMVAFMQYAALFTQPIQEMAERFTQLQAAQASAERLQSLLDTVPEIQDSEEVKKAIAAHEAQGLNLPELADDGLPRLIDEIQFRDVNFHYKPEEPVLIDFDLTVAPGESIALVGATGSGKSTIVSLLARFYEPTGGEILIDGVEYRERSLHWLQSNLGIVLQAPHLFAGSIRDNIRYGRLEATDEEVESASALVNAHEFISRMENGYDTDVGERGDRLSTGQKQLVSLARAVLADPQIFIMDEATSSVDTETERLIQSGIERVLEGRISFIIAHRLSTIRSADRILVIDHGRIVEQGSHSELLACEGKYHQLYTNQFTRDEHLRAVEDAAVAT